MKQKKKRANKYAKKIKIESTLDEVLEVLVRNPYPDKKRKSKPRKQNKPKH